MKFVLVLGCILLSGCAADNVKEALGNLDKDCVRHYTGSLSTGSAGLGTQGAVSFDITCNPSGSPVTTTIPATTTPVQK